VGHENLATIGGYLAQLRTEENHYLSRLSRLYGLAPADELRAAIQRDGRKRQQPEPPVGWLQSGGSSHARTTRRAIEPTKSAP
jgi:hypothetical protein